MILKKIMLSVALAILLFNCSQKETTKTITVKNSLDIERTFETVELSKDFLKVDDLTSIGIQESDTKKLLVTQTIDNDGDGILDVILFQPQIGANSEKVFEIVTIEESERPKADTLCYSRFVPERTDDYAWENNRVAFRTYGPSAQKMIEESIKGGTLSSGIDAWLKRVEYPIINKWYKMAENNIGAYHEDHGEGLDNFHVGVSRGVGGLAVKIDTTYYVSKNFKKWKTITTGPIRTSFVLEYADWDANGQTISETKHISLDYGSNLSRFEIELAGTDTIYAGLTLHEKDGIPTQNKLLGYISYWEPHGGSELGTAIVVPNNNMLSSNLFDTPVKDWSNLYTEIKVNNSKAIYYAGFGWKAAGEFTTKEAWENYLEAFVLKINNPLVVTIN